MPVKTKTRGQILDGSPIVAISSPIEITAAFAEANEEYMYDAPKERKGVEYPRLRNPECKYDYTYKKSHPRCHMIADKLLVPNWV